jgi:hypothetical protein
VEPNGAIYVPRMATSPMGTASYAYERNTRREFGLPNSKPVTPTASIGDILIVLKMPVVSDRLV